MINDVPSPIDLRLKSDAAEWARTAEQLRPQRPRVFEEFAQQIVQVPQVRRVLELGSGPGFLAKHLLQRFPAIEYVALDFSSAMHDLAAERVADLGKRLTFVERNFRDVDWGDGLGRFECVVTLQSVHELRHKSRARTLHEQVLNVLVEPSIYVVCDHFVGDGGMSNRELYMTIEEQDAALRQAGFSRVKNGLVVGSLSMFIATK